MIEPASKASGTWARTLFVIDDRGAMSTRNETNVVATPLDMIAHLERRTIDRVVLDGSFAANPDVARVVEELYPGVEVVALI